MCVCRISIAVLSTIVIDAAIVILMMCLCVKDPMNFGAILRGAFFLGADRVIATAKNW